MYLINSLGENGVRILFFGLMFIVFYFFMIRPKHKEEQQRENFIESLKKGKEIVTIGGIHGKIMDVGQETVVLEIDRKGSQITISKQAISIKSEA